MYYERISEMRRQKVHAQELADEPRASQILKNATNSSDNFENLFEVPVLFYVVTTLIFALKLTDSLYMWLASTYVVLRVIHSYVHCTYNRIMHRFSAYAVSTAILWIMWARLGVQIGLN